MSSTAERVLSSEELLTLGRALLAEGKEIRMRMGGHSMFPFLLPGDVASIVSVPFSNLCVGDVVVFDRGDRWVAHRLIRIEGTDKGVRYITQGDSCLRADRSFGQEHLMGRVIAVLRNGHVIPVQGLQPRYLGPVRPAARLYLTARALAGRCLRMLRGGGLSTW